jgi:hypothetical protein
MTEFDVDARIKFKKEIPLPAQSGSISVEIFGGPLARVQIAIFDAGDNILDGVGFADFGPPLTTEIGGKASWLFESNPNASYVKWGVQAVRSAANLGAYSVTAKVRDSSGNPAATGQFSATIPDGKWAGDIVYDGVGFLPELVEVMPAGANHE